MEREHYLSDSLAARARAEPLRLSPLRVAAAGRSLVRARPRARRGGLGARRRATRRLDRLHHTRRPCAARRGGGGRGGRRTRSSARRAATPCRARWWRSIRATARSAPLVGGRRYVPGGFNRRSGGTAAARLRVQALRLRGGAGPGLTPVGGGRWMRRSRSPARGRCGARSTSTASYAGPLTLRRALMRSANAATVRLGEAVGSGASWRWPAAPASGARSARSRRSRSAPAR